MPSSRFSRNHRARGNREQIYALGKEGAKELRRRRYPIPKTDFEWASKTVKWFSFDHQLLISRFVITLRLALQHADALHLAHEQREPGCPSLPAIPKCPSQTPGHFGSGTESGRRRTERLRANDGLADADRG